MADGNAIYIRFDDGFWPFARACLNSLRENYPAHPPLIVDYQGSDPEILTTLNTLEAERLRASDPPEFSRFLRQQRTGEAILDRLKLWQRPFDKFETILHLDADMLILAPLCDLFECPIPYFVANHEATSGVRVFDPVFENSSDLARLLKEDGIAPLPDPDDMANAGLFTLPKPFRNRQNLALLARLAERYGRFFAFADQSLLSLWLHASGVRPTTRFCDNYQTPFFTDPTVQQDWRNIRVLHFSSHRKPGTRAFTTWERVGDRRKRLLEAFEYYRDLPFP